MTQVQYPEWREEVIDAVRALSDLDYQRRVWVAGESIGPDFFDSLQERIHTLFDDADVLPEPGHRLGVLLRDDREVEALRPLGRMLDEVVNDLGDVPDARYLADPRWPQVVHRATAALAALTTDGASPSSAGAQIDADDR
jgi:hypothetical protein